MAGDGLSAMEAMGLYLYKKTQQGDFKWVFYISGCVCFFPLYHAVLAQDNSGGRFQVSKWARVMRRCVLLIYWDFFLWFANTSLVKLLLTWVRWSMSSLVCCKKTYNLNRKDKYALLVDTNPPTHTHTHTLNQVLIDTHPPANTHMHTGKTSMPYWRWLSNGW